MGLDSLSNYLLLSALATGIGIPAYKRGTNIMKKTYEPLDVRLQKVQLGDINTSSIPEENKFAEFRKDREKVAGDPFTWAHLTLPFLASSAAISTMGGLGGVAGPASDVIGYNIYKKLFPSIGAMSAKVQAPEEALKALATSTGKGLGTSIAETLSGAVKGLIEQNRQAIYSSPRRKLIFDQLRREDEVIKTMPLKDAMEAYHSMSEHAPTLSLDKNAVKSFLRSVAMSPEGGIDWATIKGVADAEVSLLKAKEIKANL